MTVLTVRRLFNLRGLLPNQYDSEYFRDAGEIDLSRIHPFDRVFSEGLACVAWTEHMKKVRLAQAANALESIMPLTTTRLALLVHLAQVDPAYFLLAKQMTANTLRRAAKNRAALEPFLAVWAALLLEARAPRTQAKNIGHNVMIVTSIAALTSQGWKATQAARKPGRAPERPSACQLFSDRLGSDFGLTGMGYSRIEKVWKDREHNLLRAGFTQSEVSDFLARSSPMIGGPS